MPRLHEAQLRHARHYEAMLREVDQLYFRGGQALKRAIELFDLEWRNIQTGQAWAKTHAEKNDAAAKLCSAYPDAGALLLELRQHPHDRIDWCQVALIAAKRLQLNSAESAHLNNLANAYYDVGEIRRAIMLYEQRLTIARKIGDRRGEGNALGNLGNAYYALGKCIFRRKLPVIPAESLPPGPVALLTLA